MSGGNAATLPPLWTRRRRNMKTNFPVISVGSNLRSDSSGRIKLEARRQQAPLLTRLLRPVKVAFFWGAHCFQRPANGCGDERRKTPLRCCKLIQTTQHAKTTANYEPDVEQTLSQAATRAEQEPVVARNANVPLELRTAQLPSGKG